MTLVQSHLVVSWCVLLICERKQQILLSLCRILGLLVHSPGEEEPPGAEANQGAALFSLCLPASSAGILSQNVVEGFQLLGRGDAGAWVAQGGQWGPTGWVWVPLSPVLAHPGANFILYHCHSRSYLPLPMPLPCLFMSTVGHCCQCCCLQRLLVPAPRALSCSSLPGGAAEGDPAPGWAAQLSSAPPRCSSLGCSSLQLWAPAWPVVGTRGVTPWFWGPAGAGGEEMAPAIINIIFMVIPGQAGGTG